MSQKQMNMRNESVSQLKKIMAEFEDLNSELMNARIENSELSGELQGSRSEIKDLRQMIDHHEKTTVSEDAMITLREEMGSYKGLIKHLEEDLNTCRTSLEEKESRLLLTTNEIKECRASAERAQLFLKDMHRFQSIPQGDQINYDTH